MLKNFSEIRIILIFATLSVLSVTTVLASTWKDQLYDSYGMELAGFFELRQGQRFQDDPHEKDASISEARLQIEMEKDFEWGIFNFKGDLTGDNVEENIQEDMRELNLAVSPFDKVDMKIGRQTLTWGTGDLLFVNDLFPKDWKSFFIGRDDEYLKAPSDAVKASLFSEFANLDLVYTPLFNGSEYIDGTRLSYWNSALGRTAGRDFIFNDHQRNSFPDDSEYALRLSKAVGSHELAVYGYYGFWKTPEGMDPVSMKLTYPRLAAYGASIRSSISGGIGNFEIGYYDSRDDSDGDDSFVRNSEVRVLAGFERELAKNFTGGLQYYLEWMSDYDAYQKSMGNMPKKDEHRHVLTLRLTKFMMSQNLKLSLFAYFSPSDEDVYLRPKAHYKVTDAWAVELGGNIFAGTDDHTFFGQFQDNTNAYASVRWSF